MNRLGRIALYGSIAVVLVYGAGWYYFSKKFEKHIENDLAHIQAKGFDVSFDKLAIGGFPFGYDVTFTNLSFSRGNFFKSWVDGNITFSAKLWKPQEINSIAAGTHHLEFDNIKMKGDKLTLTSLNSSHLKFSYGPFNVDINDKPVLSTENFEVDMRLVPQEHGIELKASSHEVFSPLLAESPLGETIQDIQLTTFMQGNIDGTNTVERLKNWYKSDGTLEVKKLTLKYGSLALEGEGTLSIDEQLQPLAAFTFEVEGLDNTIDSFVEKKMIKPNVGTILKAGANFFNNGNKPKLSFSIQNQEVLLGGIPVTEIPKINWAKNEQN